MKKTSDAQLKAQTKYDTENTVQIHLKLNRGTDADILAWLEGKPKQTVIKEAIREMMRGRE
jgi:hypothetical protein